MSTSQPEPEQVERVFIQTSSRTIELGSSHEFLLLTYSTPDRRITSLVASQPICADRKKTRQTKELVS